MLFCRDAIFCVSVPSIRWNGNQLTLYNAKYRVESMRLPDWNYASNWYYYVTICVKNRVRSFGEILNVETQHLASQGIGQKAFVQFSVLGKAAEKCWKSIPEHFKFVRLDEFVIMPNHIHGIIIIDRPKKETQDIASLPKPRPQSGSLSSIVRGFKIGVTKWANDNNIPFEWQSRFYEHIIRDDRDFDRIRSYIQNNPANWDTDEENI